jgi:hypothetical protein
MHCSDAYSNADASFRSNCQLTAMALTCSYELFCIDAPATFYALLRMRTLSISNAEGFPVIYCGKVDYDKSSDCID